MLPRKEKDIHFEISALDARVENYSRFKGAINREIQKVRDYNVLFREMPVEDIERLQRLYLSGLKGILLRDLFFEHALAQVKDGDTVYLPEIYPWEYVESLPSEDALESLKGKCILASYRKAYSVADQLERVRAGKGLTGQRCYMYKHLEIGHTGSGGNHRIIAASMADYDIKAPLTIIDDERLVRDFSTDGGYWYLKNGEVIGEVHDYRVALIFSITKSLLTNEFKIV